MPEKKAEGPALAPEGAEPQGFETATDAGSALLDLMGDRDVDAFDAAPETDEGSEVTAEPAEEPAAEEAVEASDEATDEPAETAEPAAPAEEPLVTVRIDGKDEQVPLSEALAGYSRTASFTRKSQALAEARKSFESERTAVRDEREKYEQNLTLLERAIADTLPPEPDWDSLRAEDPAKYAAAHADWHRRQTQLEAVRKEREAAETKRLGDARTEFERTVVQERERLVEAVPEWKDVKIAETEKRKLVEYARDLGYSDEQIGAVVDHRVFVMLRKAMLFDEGRAKAERSKAPPAKTLKPGAKPGGRKPKPDDALVRARKRLRSTGRASDAAVALEGLLPEE